MLLISAKTILIRVKPSNQMHLIMYFFLFILHIKRRQFLVDINEYQ
jgi:hypothetical protein